MLSDEVVSKTIRYRPSVKQPRTFLLPKNLSLCYSYLAFVALVSPFVRSAAGFNLRSFLFPTRFPRCLGE